MVWRTRQGVGGGRAHATAGVDVETGGISGLASAGARERRQRRVVMPHEAVSLCEKETQWWLMMRQAAKAVVWWPVTEIS